MELRLIQIYTKICTYNKHLPENNFMVERILSTDMPFVYLSNKKHLFGPNLAYTNNKLMNYSVRLFLTAYQMI